MTRLNNLLSLAIFIIGLAGALYVHVNVQPTWLETQLQYQTYVNENNKLVYKSRGNEVEVPKAIHYENSEIRQSALEQITTEPTIKQQWVYLDGKQDTPVLLKADYHYGWWSLLPALIAVVLCLVSREPLFALFSGILVGAFILGRFDLSTDILIPSLATENAASIILLYLWLLGGLMGIWAKTGAAQAFADHMSQHYVKGPKSAKLITWFLGLVFFQGGTMSTVLVGTTVKPMADKAKVSHEELSYVVDSTASPIASVIAFNAWPAYVQALIYVPGVAFLATEADRISFFFSSIPFSFYGILAVVGTLLLSLEITRFSGGPMRKAILRARETGKLDADHASPVSAKELHTVEVPEGYQSHWLEFILPLVALIAVAVITFVTTGSPQIHWAFGSALFLSTMMAFAKGMQLRQVLEGFANGWKGVVVASIILMLAITIGAMSKQLGGGLFMVDLLGHSLPFWALPVILQLMTMLIAFSTGTSWGTYAIAFPLAMPLVWAISQSQELANPEIYMMICFATVLNGSVFGDQCSPISDTTILSSMTTGCDLMDHVKTQIIPASFAAITAGGLWTISALLLA